MKYSNTEKQLLDEIKRLQIQVDVLIEFTIITPKKLTEYRKLVIQRQKDSGLLSDVKSQDRDNNSPSVRFLD